MARNIPKYQKELERLLKQRKSLQSIQSLMLENFGIHLSLQQLEKRFKKLHNESETSNAKNQQFKKELLLYLRAGKKCCTYQEINEHFRSNHNLQFKKSKIIEFVRTEVDMTTDDYKVHTHPSGAPNINTTSKNSIDIKQIESVILESAAKFSHPQVALFSDHILRSLSKIVKSSA